MAIVQSYTKEHMDEILNDTIASAEIVDGELVFTTVGTDEINVGQVVGPTGAAGTNGTNGATGPTGPAGPTTMRGVPVQVTTAGSLMSVSGAIPGLVKNNVSVVAGRTYGINVDFLVELASVDVDAEWDFWCRLNGTNLDRFTSIHPGVTGVSYQPVKGQVFWVAPTTQATDDFDVFAGKVTTGSNITPSGSSTLKRKLWIVDYGVVT